MKIKTLFKTLRAYFILNRIGAILIKSLRLSLFYAKWPLKGNIKFNILNQSVLFYSNCDDYLVSRYYYSGYDEEIYELEFLSTMIQDKGDFIDIGSFNGLFSIILGKKYPGMSFYAFEPNPSNFQRLTHNIILNTLENVTPINSGVSDRLGHLNFYMPIDQSMTTVSSFDQSFYRRHSNTQLVKKRVEVTSIDDFCEKNNLEPQIIKIDVEGHENQVLNGAQKVIRKYKPIILCEIFTKRFDTEDDFHKRMPNIYRINKFFRELNYSFYHIDGRTSKQIQSLNFNNFGRNLLFIPE